MDDCLYATSSRNSKNKDAFSLGRSVIPIVENQSLPVLQLNAEELTNAKLEIIRQLADSNQVAVELLQETHIATDYNLQLPGFLLAGSIPGRPKHHGMATLIRTGHPLITWCCAQGRKTCWSWTGAVEGSLGEERNERVKSKERVHEPERNATGKCSYAICPADTCHRIQIPGKHPAERWLCE